MGSEAAHLRQSRFTEHFIRTNSINEYDFKEWIFYPGMLFGSSEKWWGDSGERDAPHEGLDLCMCRNGKGEVCKLASGTNVPVMYDGTVVGIISDFLGQTVIVEHQLNNAAGKFCTMYAHTVPLRDIHPGMVVKEGDVIASIADTSQSKSGILPHLHISAGAVSEKIPYAQLEWRALRNTKELTLLDPLKLLDGQYALVSCP